MDAGVEQAERLSRHPGVMGALSAIADDESNGLQERALTDPAAFLAEHDVIVPPEVQVTFTVATNRGKPDPEWQPVTIEQTRCRTYWIKHKDGTVTKEEICLSWVFKKRKVPPIA